MDSPERFWTVCSELFLKHDVLLVQNGSERFWSISRVTHITRIMCSMFLKVFFVDLLQCWISLMLINGWLVGRSLGLSNSFIMCLP